MKTLEVRSSEISGRSCYALVELKKRKKFAEYTGELVRGKRRINERLRRQEAAGVIKVVTLADDLGIDGEVGGNETAYINHSCAPNAFMRIVPGDRVAFFALRDIAPGEEITIDYRNDENPAMKECKCGAENCRWKRNKGMKDEG